MNPASWDALLPALAVTGGGSKLLTALAVTGCVIYGLIGLILMLAILLQESKGGGLAALGGTRAESAFGASNPLRKLTTVLSIIFLILAGALSLALAPGKSVAEEKQAAPAEGTKAPATGGTSATVDIPAGEPKKETPKDAAKEVPAPAPAPPQGP